MPISLPTYQLRPCVSLGDATLWRSLSRKEKAIAFVQLLLSAISSAGALRAIALNLPSSPAIAYSRRFTIAHSPQKRDPLCAITTK